MNAQEIIKIILKINRFGFGQRDFGMIPENRKLVDMIFDLAKQIEPCDKYRNGIDRKLWLWANKGSFEDFADTFRSHFTSFSLEDLDDSIEPRGPLSFSVNKEKLKSRETVDYEKMKKAWPEYFPDDTVWFMLYLAEHDGNRGIFIGGLFGSRLIIDTAENLQIKMDMSPLLEWIIDSEKKCIEMIRQGTYSSFIAENLPFEHRSGVTKLSTYWKYVPEDRERLFGDIDPAELDQFLAWDENEDTGWKKMTADDYFRLCDQLYDLLGLKEKFPVERENGSDKPFTPKEYFTFYSGAIHYHTVEYLLNLKEDSAKAFKDFVRGGFPDAHKWEACLMDRISLRPVIMSGKFYIDIYFDHKVDNYPLLIHLLLGLREKGYPMLKQTDIEEHMSGDRLIRIDPHGDDFDWRYEDSAGFYTEESRSLPAGRREGLIKEIQWFPTGEWSMADEKENNIRSRDDKNV